MPYCGACSGQPHTGTERAAKQRQESDYGYLYVSGDKALHNILPVITYVYRYAFILLSAYGHRILTVGSEHYKINVFIVYAYPASEGTFQGKRTVAEAQLVCFFFFAVFVISDLKKLHTITP